MRKFLLFSLPAILWVILFRDFICGVIAFNMDTNTIYAVAKYYFNGLFNGSVPLWEPYVCLGRPFYALVICNLFNPVTQLVPILKLAGLNYQQAFGVYMTVYFLIGCVGFYELCKHLLNNKLLGYIGYVAIMFSGIGVSMFNQLTLLEIFVPTAWFFAFVLRFKDRPHVGNLWGLGLSAALLLISYLPFYFLTLCLFVGLFLMVFYLKPVGEFMLSLRQCVLKNKAQTVAVLLCLVCAALPLWSYKLIDATHEAVAPARHCANAEHIACYNNTMNDLAGMSYEEASRSGGLAERVDLGSLFSHLDKITYGSDHFFFLPLLIMLLIAMGVFVRSRRLLWFLLAITLCISLIALADVSRWHYFLFVAFPLFKYFRNLFFFETFLMPLLILIALVQYQALTMVELSTWTRRKMFLVATLIVHGAGAWFLSQYQGILWSMWAVLGLSAVYWGMFACWKIPKAWNPFLLLFLMVLQPIEVFTAYRLNAEEFKTPLAQTQVATQFNWVRPPKPEQQPGRIYKFVPYENFWYQMNLTDSSGYIGYSESATRFSFMLEQWFGETRTFNYARHKMILYDRTVHSDDAPSSLARAAKVISQGENVAFIAETQEKSVPSLSDQAQRLEGPSDLVRVEEFTPNSLRVRTQLPTEKFLVYNDAFTSLWKVYVNNQPSTLFRANFAFKGVWVPAGASIVEFRYEPPVPGWVYVGLTLLLCACCAWAGLMLWRFRRWNLKEETCAI